MDEPIKVLSFVVTDRRDDGLAQYLSFNWRIWAHGTSFYMKVNHPSMSEMKISLHGPDPRPDKTPFFRLGPDSSFSANEDVQYGSLFAGAQSGWPITFTGQRITSRVRRVIRFSFSSEMFTEGAPNGLPVSLSKGAKKLGQHARFTVPLDAGLFVDLYIADPGVDPYWQDKEETRAANAGVGPIVNDAGQTLTVVANKTTSPHRRDPNWQQVSDDDIKEIAAGKTIRAIALNSDDNGLLWITEKIAPADFGPDYDDLLVGVQRPARQDAESPQTPL